MVLETVNENVLKLSGDVSLADIYSRFPEKELFVEPLSSQKPLSEFVSSGGFGYGALREGPLNSRIFRMKWQRPKYSFRYGLTNSTLYAAGYPLHRITAALPNEFYNRSLGEISELIIPVRDREDVNVVYEPKENVDFHVASMSRDVLFVNDKAASLVGLPGQGTVTTYPPEVPPESDGEDAGDFLDKRFIGDDSNWDQTLRILTQKSGAAKLYELAGPDNLFFALSVNIGLLAIVSGHEIAEQVADMPLTYVI
jgi:hypothetical protein